MQALKAGHDLAGPALDAVLGLDDFASSGPEGAAARGVVGKRRNRGNPFVGRVGKVARDAVTHHRALHADGVGHHGQPGRHVLQDLESALSAAPVVVGKPTDADVGVGQFGGLGGARPRAGLDLQVFQRGEAIADDPERHVGNATRDVVEQGGGALEALRGAGRADPHQPQATPGIVPGRRIVRRRQGRGDDEHRTIAVAPGMSSEEVVAGPNEVGQRHRVLKTPQTPGAERSAGRVRITQEDSIIEVVDQRGGPAAKLALLPERQQLALQQDHGVVRQAAQLPPARNCPGGQDDVFDFDARAAQRRLVGHQAVAAADVLAAFYEREELHAGHFLVVWVQNAKKVREGTGD